VYQIVGGALLKAGVFFERQAPAVRHVAYLKP
jgi:hypothetical protein